ncbi:hypothetical protein GCM10027271_26960 [Saccharopolyspora gloriosae]|uniref:Uncharacterized protein n=1 Tax=Saccharopolyspora gloriosae TaxID=455344 RepID=A0A840NN89_9PSEU|nr:hypothetical protein [Saccharopolyspora gloriosae]MBB5071465.1 hypothetical protein [Saccharopolyspora gloriosae]
MTSPAAVRFTDAPHPPEHARSLLAELSTEHPPDPGVVELLVSAAPSIARGPGEHARLDRPPDELVERARRFLAEESVREVVPDAAVAVEADDTGPVPAAAVGFTSIFVLGSAEGVVVQVQRPGPRWQQDAVAHRLVADALLLSTAFTAGSKVAAPALRELTDRLARGTPVRPPVVAYHLLDRVRAAVRGGVEPVRMAAHLSTAAALLDGGQRRWT